MSFAAASQMSPDSLAPDCLELGGGVLDRVEVERVGRQMAQDCSCAPDRPADVAALVGGQIVHDDPLAAP